MSSHAKAVAALFGKSLGDAGGDTARRTAEVANLFANTGADKKQHTGPRKVNS